jgi:porphobilinogen synthase
MSFPATRLRRLRRTSALRGLVRETELSVDHLVYPLFVTHGQDRREPIESMPGIERLTISHLEDEAGQIAALGVPAVLLFGIPADKDTAASVHTTMKASCSLRCVRSSRPSPTSP